jgi:hypothetical protein
VPICSGRTTGTFSACGRGGGRRRARGRPGRLGDADEAGLERRRLGARPRL